MHRTNSRSRYQYPSGHANRKLQHVLEHARTSISPYKGEWSAPWLLTPIRSQMWKLSTPESRLVGNEWKGTENIDWNISLANRTKLYDSPENRTMLEAAQQAGFLFRRLPIFNVNSSSAHIHRVRMLTMIIEWMYLHEDVYHPATSQFRLLDSDSVADFTERLMRGGKAWLLNIPERLLEFLYMNACQSAPPKRSLLDPFDIRQSDAKQIRKWLAQHQFYIQNECRSGGAHLDRIKLAEVVGCDQPTLSNDKLSAFLRQFEPDLANSHPHLLVSSTGYQTEYPSHRTPLIGEAKQLRTSLSRGTTMLETWRQLFRLRRHLPEYIPATDSINLRISERIVEREAALPGRTPWIPLATSLRYLRESLRLICEFAEPLFSFYIRALEHFDRQGYFNEIGTEPSLSTTIRKNRAKRDEWVDKNLPESLYSLKISGWVSIYARPTEADTFAQLRHRPSLPDMVEVMIGAILTLLGTLKPIREGEVRLLKQDCISIKGKSGYWITQVCEKRGIDAVSKTLKRPIPEFLAKALLHIQMLANCTAKLTNESDPFAHNSLFYLPSFALSSNLNANVFTTRELNSCFDTFCDYVGFPTDAYGRRWYIRFHELRKSFFITFFWSFKFGSLEAAAWMGGHGDSSALWTYLKSEIDGDEISRIEANYASEQLWLFETHRRSEAKNIEALHAAVCRHFSVNEITLIDSRSLEEWLRGAFRKGTYEIYAFHIDLEGDFANAGVAFRVREEKC